MWKIMLAILLLFSLSTVLGSQQQAPQLLLHATHCLAAKEFLSISGVTKVAFGFILDEKSYPGDKVIYVVEYAAPVHSDGLVFAILLTASHGRQVFSIENNASFVLTADEANGVSFVDPPLGDAWTQEHVSSAIKAIEKQPRFTLAVRSLFSADPSVVCEAYTDS